MIIIHYVHLLKCHLVPISVYDYVSIKSKLLVKGDELLVALYIMEERVERRGGKGRSSHSFQILDGRRLEYSE